MNEERTAPRGRVAVLEAALLPVGACASVDAFGTRIALFNVDGVIRAVNNRCPHFGGPLCSGRVGGRVLASVPHEHIWSEEPTITCPWHGWQFDLASGSSLFDPKVGVRVYDTVVEDGHVFLLEPAHCARDGSAAPAARSASPIRPRCDRPGT
jgi:nitrite reductase (NADH) small subunit